MPLAAVGAAVGVASGISSGKGAKKAAQIQANAEREKMARLERMYNMNANNFRADIRLGDAASARQAALLGLPGGDGSTPTEILRETPGYEFRMSEALKGVNSNAYASGMGNSGATLKALQDRAYDVADQSFNSYFAQVGDVANRGVGAKSALAGVSTTFANNANDVTQDGADTRSNYEMFKAQNRNNMMEGLAEQFGSSFGGRFK